MSRISEVDVGVRFSGRFFFKTGVGVGQPAVTLDESPAGEHFIIIFLCKNDDSMGHLSVQGGLWVWGLGGFVSSGSWVSDFW